jgi:methionyl aminopeptidase
MKKGEIKTEEEIRSLAEGGKILAAVLREVAERALPGVSTFELNEFAEKKIREGGAIPSFKGYKGPKGPYPAGLCTSINNVVVHGIPKKDDILKEGDIIGLDCGVIYKKLFTDAAITVPVGDVSAVALKLIETTRRALKAGIFAATAGGTIGDIGHAIQSTVEEKGFSVVRDLVGHGVGYAVHEEPAVPCYGSRGTGPLIREGMVLAIEPMVNAGGFRVVFDRQDGWTVRTADGSLSAHFEHTVAITKNGAIILTAGNDEL